MGDREEAGEGAGVGEPPKRRRAEEEEEEVAPVGPGRRARAGAEAGGGLWSEAGVEGRLRRSV